MAKLMEQESALVTEEESLMVEPKIGIADETTTQEVSAHEATPSPLPWIGSMPRSNYGVMAVVNEDGYLVPLWTAGDLLRACKIIWRAAKD